MSENRDLISLRANSIVMESFHEMGLAMEGRDRMGYVEAALEAFSDPNKQAGLLNKLFKDFQKADAIDFGRIPDSKGNIIKYQYYPQMNDMLELLNELAQGNVPDSIISLNKLNGILLNNVDDFTFGYRTGNYIITNTYRLMVMALYDIIDVCIVDVTKSLREKLTAGETKKEMRRTREITKTVNSFIKMYENGQWNTLMKAMKSGKVDIAHEAFSASVVVDAGKNVAGQVAGGIADAQGDKRSLFTTIKDKWAELPKALQVIGGAAIAIISLLLIARKLIYLFYRLSNKISNSLKTSAKILRKSVESENDVTSDSATKQIKILDTLETVSDVIEYKIIKSEEVAEKELAVANKQDFSKQELVSLNDTSFNF